MKFLLIILASIMILGCSTKPAETPQVPEETQVTSSNKTSQDWDQVMEDHKAKGEGKTDPSMNLASD